MFRRKLVTTFTLLAFLGCLLSSPAISYGQSVLSMPALGVGGGILGAPGASNMMTQILPAVVGGVAGWFLGSSFGPVGRIVGAVAGAGIASWLASTFLQHSAMPGGYASDIADPSLSGGYYQNNTAFSGQTAGGGTYDPNTGMPYPMPAYDPNTGQYLPAPAASETGGSDLATLQAAYQTATTGYQSALAGTDGDAIVRARAAFEQASQAYNTALGSAYQLQKAQ